MQIAFTSQKNFGKEARELKWAHAHRTLHGLHPPETKMFTDRSRASELNQLAEEAKRRAEIARYIFNLFFTEISQDVSLNLELATLLCSDSLYPSYPDIGRVSEYKKIGWKPMAS